MLNRNHQIALTALIVSLFSATSTIAKPVAQGSVALDKANWTVADAIAYPDGVELEVVFSDAVFDRKEMAADGKVDTFDAMRHDGNTLTLNFDADGPTMCLDVSTRTEEGSYSGSTCNSEFQPTIKVSARSAERIAGSMHWGEKDAQHVHLSFDVAIAGGTSAGAVARPGKPLPADGGAPGKAMLAHFGAVTAGDWSKLKSISHPDRRQMMEASEKAGEHKEMFEFLQKFVPKKIKISGGMIDGDQAQVDYSAEEAGKPVKGTADVVQFESKWYFVGSTTHD